MDYKYLRWQVIDTPGVLDHPLEEMNTIEMQSITALAHLRSAVLYFMDLSEQCGYTIEAQCKLFHSIKPLFANKPTMLVINKIDVCRLEELGPENRAFVDEIINGENVQVVQASCYTEEGVMAVRDASCDALLAHRVEQKLRGNRLEAVANKIHVAVPKARDTVARPAFIPEAAKTRKKYDKNDPERIKLEKEIEQEMEGKAIFSADTRKPWLLEDPSWKYDVMPEIMDGKNVADFIDPDIAERLEELEREEERLEAEGFYASDDEEIVCGGGPETGRFANIFPLQIDSEEEEIRDAAEQIASKKAVIKKLSQAKNTLKNRPIIPRKNQHVSLKDFTTGMRKVGLDPKTIEKRAKKLVAAKQKAYEEFVARGEEASGEEGGMDVDMAGEGEVEVAGRSGRAGAVVDRRAPRTNRQLQGMATVGVSVAGVVNFGRVSNPLLQPLPSNPKRPGSCGASLSASRTVSPRRPSRTVTFRL